MAKVVVFHSGYGCDTGCCGHMLEVDGETHSFSFDHPYSNDHRTWAEEFVKESGCDPSDLDWENCLIIDD